MAEGESKKQTNSGLRNFSTFIVSTSKGNHECSSGKRCEEITREKVGKKMDVGTYSSSKIWHGETCVHLY